jgi:hypothetical protein
MAVIAAKKLLFIFILIWYSPFFGLNEGKVQFGMIKSGKNSKILEKFACLYLTL